MEKLTSVEVLWNARQLLRTRGWVARRPGVRTPFGPDEGPLMLSQALWRGGSGKTVSVAAIGQACTLLCRSLGLEDDSFVDLGAWSREAGRTQEQVLDALQAVLLTEWVGVAPEEETA